ncbi:hypothetical protein LTR37_004814 [Vermiconidia calcicola]|uniref:Uncharacterized protein n=1 Tax=Vermiconidia calcicola TaxID=1690605 RepID=A0ACC3NL13_9PEZI|nr:hypothetical protein LTR37_004814 [Vermiconidia calcicola]
MSIAENKDPEECGSVMGNSVRADALQPMDIADAREQSASLPTPPDPEDTSKVHTGSSDRPQKNSTFDELLTPPKTGDSTTPELAPLRQNNEFSGGNDPSGSYFPTSETGVSPKDDYPPASDDIFSPRAEGPPSVAVNDASSDEASPLRVMVFDIQSTSSRLFSKQLSTHLRLGQITHPYVLAATLGPNRIHTKLGNDQTKKLWESRVKAAPSRVTAFTYESATNKLLRDADKLEQQGKTLFVTEYAPFLMKHDVMLSAIGSQQTVISKLENPTIVPDELLKLFTPIIFIQHPAIVIPAWLRLAKSEYGSNTLDDEDFTVWTSLRWSRILFDYLRASQGFKRQDSTSSGLTGRYEPRIVATRPYVIDADDVTNNTHGTLAAICRLLGVQIEVVTQSWTEYFARATEAVKSVIPDSFMKVFADTQIDSQASQIDLDFEMLKWKEEFGEESAELLLKKVEEDLPHYEYLKSFRLRVLAGLTTGSLRQSITGMPERRQTETKNSPVSTTSGGVESGHPMRIIRSALFERPHAHRNTTV